MQHNLGKIPASAQEWFDKARLAPTLAEAAFCHRKADLALELEIGEPRDPGCGAWLAARRGSHRFFH